MEYQISRHDFIVKTKIIIVLSNTITFVPSKIHGKIQLQNSRAKSVEKKHNNRSKSMDHVEIAEIFVYPENSVC